MTKQRTRIAPAFPPARVPRLMWLTAVGSRNHYRSPASDSDSIERGPAGDPHRDPGTCPANP